MKTDQSNSIVLASGGADSTTLLYDLRAQGDRPTPLFVDYGQHCAATERATLEAVTPDDLAKQIVTLDVSCIYKGSHSGLIKEIDLWTESINSQSLYLPYRNLLLLSIGAAYAKAHGQNGVFAAFINSNHAQEIDCSQKFFVQLNDLLSEYGGVPVSLPYRDLTKGQVLRRALKLGVPLGRTFSCQTHSTIPCGACPNCVDRLDAIQEIRKGLGVK